MIQLRYRPTSLFHFKRIDSTNKGALTLPMPTPYAVRCALLAVSDDPEAAFDRVKSKRIVVTPPADIVHNPCWVKILDLKRSEFKTQWDNPEATAEYQSTMSMREYAYIPSDGSSDIMIYIDSLEGIEDLPGRINYFGKRGSFVQFISKEDNVDAYIPLEGMECILQDFSSEATWENVNVYTSKKSVREKFIQAIEPSLVIRGVKHTYYKFR